ncbi:hypothetical protein SH1V18_48330 [Vallitalea longa]|uniref:HTH cro/C1-type domain-containing protein n=1 Tax=Vallitalea longa TaxID=2936439 RepID=A0A9W5YJ85_9FIRM|nr:winged helix-turn-helix transcriptional regulator [Vallitalea longa]GKX32353.1 hypothetical protein SH1V18_48330 [Vallitalea longa]
MRINEKSIYNLYPALLKYPLIIKVLLEHKNDEGVSCISQKEIAKRIGLTQTAISKYLSRLEHIDKCIEKISPAKYFVYRENMLQYGPVSKVIKFHNLAISNKGFLLLDFEKQVIKLGFTKEATLIAKHYVLKYLYSQ